MPIRNIVPHISCRGPPCRRTTKKDEDFEELVISLLSPRKFVIQTWFGKCQQYLCLFHIVFEYIPGFHDQGKMLVLPNQLICSILFTSDEYCVFPANFMISTYTDKNNPFPRCTNKHSQLESFSQPCCNRIFSNCFSQKVLPKNDHTDFAKEERLGFPYWTMILSICVVVDVSKYLDILTLEFTIICEHLPLLLGYKADTASAACPAHQYPRTPLFTLCCPLIFGHGVPLKISHSNLKILNS